MSSGRYESSEGSTIGTAVTFFLIGLGAGALTALALAPKDANVQSEVAEAYEALGERSLAIKYLHLALQNGFPKMQIEGAIGLIRVSADPEFQKYGK